MTIKYFKLAPQKIVQDILFSVKRKRVNIRDLEFVVYPHVYPSDKFRTTNFLLDSIQPIIVNKHICDMGCGLGVVGLFSLKNGAKSVVQADINPIAVKNARMNRSLHNYKKERVRIFESDCFDHIPVQKFDLIIFNIPFHSEPCEIREPLQYAFHDPEFKSVRKFLKQSQVFSNPQTEILIPFSNKGNTNELENLFVEAGFKWHLWKRINTSQEFDNRIYMLNKM